MHTAARPPRQRLRSSRQVATEPPQGRQLPLRRQAGPTVPSLVNPRASPAGSGAGLRAVLRAGARRQRRRADRQWPGRRRLVLDVGRARPLGGLQHRRLLPARRGRPELDRRQAYRLQALTAKEKFASLPAAAAAPGRLNVVWEGRCPTCGSAAAVSNTACGHFELSQLCWPDR
jgi:hypothetical protein